MVCVVVADDLKLIAGLVRFIVGGNQLLNAELLEVQLEVAEEVAGISAEAVPEMVLSVLSDSRVIRVAENDFVLKVFAVVAQFVVPSRFMRKIVCRLRLSEVSRQ